MIALLVAAMLVQAPEPTIASYQEALQRNPKWAAGWWMAGSMQYDSRLFAEGAESLSHLVELTPQAGAAWALLGLCEYETGGYAKSLEHIQRSLALGVGNQPQMTLVLKFHEAALLTKMGRFDEAMRKYSGFLPRGVTDEQVLLGLGLAQLRHAVVPSALPAEAPAHQRDMPLAAGRALAVLLAGEDAQLAYEELAAKFPADADAHYAYGYFLFGRDADRAIQEWRRALAIDHAHAAAHGMLAWVFWLREEKAEALEHARKALEKDPGLITARIVLGRLSTNGVPHLERAAREDPANLEAHLALATAYSSAGRKAEARAQRELCLALQGETGAAAQQ